MRRNHFQLYAFVLYWSATFAVPAYGNEIADCRQSKKLDLKIMACTRLATNGNQFKVELIKAYNMRASVALYAGADIRAKADFTRLIELEPQDARHFSNRGLARLRLGDFDGAILDLSHAINQRPDTAQTYEHRARAYHQAGKLEPAANDLTTAIGQHPAGSAKHAYLYKYRGIVLSKMGQHSRALDDLTGFIATHPRRADGYQVRARAYFRQGAYKNALRDIDQASKYDRHDEATTRLYAQILAAQKVAAQKAAAPERKATSTTTQPARQSENQTRLNAFLDAVKNVLKSYAPGQ